jgi:hypothetical protein
MSTTATSTLGYGIRIDPDAFTSKAGTNEERYSDVYLDEQKYPLLYIAYEGFSSANIHHKPNHWIFVKPGLSRIYSGISGDGMAAPVHFPNVDDEEFKKAESQLRKWSQEHGQENSIPQWAMALWIN